MIDEYIKKQNETIKKTIDEMRSELKRLDDYLVDFHEEIENNKYDISVFTSSKRSACKRGVIELKYKLTQLVKKLY